MFLYKKVYMYIVGVPIVQALLSLGLIELCVSGSMLLYYYLQLYRV